MSMTSSRGYLMRALYEWIVDNQCTPYVLVNAELEGVDVPRQYVKNGEIVLNVSPSAVMELSIDNQRMFFNARFGGVPMDVHVPLFAVVGIYARENGQGMIFEPEEGPDGPDDNTPEPPPPADGGDDGRPKLRVVK